MAQLKDLIVNGPSRFIGDVYATTFTGNLEGNASTATSATTAAALTGKTLVTASSVTTSNWSTYGNNHIPTMSFMAYWNGAYSGTSSNLTYCKQGTIIGSNNIGSQSVSYATTSESCSGNAASSTQSLLLSNTSHAKAVIGVYFHRDYNVTSLVGNTEGNGAWGHPSDNQDKSYGNASILRIGWSNKYYTDIFTGPNGADGKYGLQWRQIVNNGANNWRTLLDSSNLKYYALPLSGGTMSNTNVVTNLNADLLDGYHASSFAKVASHNNLMSSSNEFTFASSAYAGEIFINYRTAGGTNGAITKYSFYNGAGGLLASIFKGQFSGNAASASKWENARTITLTGSVTGSVSIDGSQNVSLVTTTNHTHNYAGSSSAGGSANSALTLLYNNKFDTNYGNYAIFQQSSNKSDFPHLGWFNSIKMLHNNSYGYFTEIATSFTGEDGMWRRALLSGTQAGWYKILDSGNYNSYSPKLDGTGATGTWGINISGKANIANNLLFVENIPANTRGELSRDYRLYTGLWSKKDLGYASQYGQFIDLSGGTTWYHRLAFNTTGVIEYFKGINTTTLTKVGDLAYTSSNVASATKLQNSRTIWGQSFDGTGNVNGDITFYGKVNTSYETTITNTDGYGLLFRFSNGVTGPFFEQSGNVGIGTKSPSYKLHVAGTAYASGGLVSDGPVKVNESFVVDGTNGSWYGKLNIADEVYILGEDTNINFIESLNIKQHNITNNTETSIVSIDNSGNITLNVMNDNGGSYEISTRSGALGIGIPSDDPNLVKTPSFLMSNRGYIYINASLPSSPNYPLVVNGTIQCTTLSQTSDIKYKSNIKQIEYEEALKIIENLNPVTWDWNENTVETGSSSGFVAQEAEKFIPNAISRDNENNLSLDYTQLHSYEIKVIQEQQKEIIKLKEKLKILENLIS